MADENKYKLAKILIVVAVLLSFFAVIAESPYTVSIVPVNSDEEFKIGGNVVKILDAEELANWIIEKRSNFVLLDSRSEKEYNKYHIPRSLNFTANYSNNLNQNKSSINVIYDQGSRYIIESIKPLIKDLGGEVYLLKNGMSGWMNEVLFPDLRETNLSKEEINKIYKISSFFGGKPVSDKERKRKKYSREGC